MVYHIVPVNTANLPGLFPGPAEADHDRVVHEASYMNQLNPPAYQTVPPKLRNNIKYSELRTLLSSIHSLQEDHPLLPVTVKEIRESGGFGEKWSPISSEARAIAALKFLKLVVAINGTIYTPEAFKSAKDLSSHYIPNAKPKLVLTREGDENIVQDASVSMTSKLTWADLRQPSHPNPTAILLVTSKHWPGPTALAEVVNAYSHAIFFSEPCSALDIKLSSFGGEYGRLMAPEGGMDSLCAPLVLRLLTCDFTEEDTKLLINDHFGMTKSKSVRESAIHTSPSEQHKALITTCKASAIRLVHEDRVLSREQSDIMAKGILNDQFRLLHLVRDPRAMLVSRLEMKALVLKPVEGESKKEFMVRKTKNANTLRCDGEKFNIIDCIKNSCESFEHSLDRVEYLLHQVFGKSTNLQLLSGAKQFLRVRYEELMNTPNLSVEKLFKWFGNVQLSVVEVNEIASTIESSPTTWRTRPSTQSSSSSSTKKHSWKKQQPSQRRRRRRRLSNQTSGDALNMSDIKQIGSEKKKYLTVFLYPNQTFSNNTYLKEARQSEQEEYVVLLGNISRRIYNGSDDSLQEIDIIEGSRRTRRRMSVSGGLKHGNTATKFKQQVLSDELSRPKLEVAWDLISQRQLEVATKECAPSLRRLEYADATSSQGGLDETSVSLPAWAWTIIPPKKSLTLPSPAVKKKKWDTTKIESS